MSIYNTACKRSLSWEHRLQCQKKLSSHGSGWWSSFWAIKRYENIIMYAERRAVHVQVDDCAGLHRNIKSLVIALKSKFKFILMRCLWDSKTENHNAIQLSDLMTTWASPILNPELKSKSYTQAHWWAQYIVVFHLHCIKQLPIPTAYLNCDWRNQICLFFK